MAFIVGNAVDIPAVTKQLPPNPLLGYDGFSTAPPSPSSARLSSAQSTLAHRVLLNDQRCLITGAVSSQLQACYLIPMKVSNKDEKLIMRKEVVRRPFLNTLDNSKTCCLGTDPHSATIWLWRLCLGQSAKLHSL